MQKIKVLQKDRAFCVGGQKEYFYILFKLNATRLAAITPLIATNPFIIALDLQTTKIWMRQLHQISNLNSYFTHFCKGRIAIFSNSFFLIKYHEYQEFITIKRTSWICVSYSQWIWQRQFLLASIPIQFHFLPSSFLLNVQITMWSRVGCVSWYPITQSGMTKHRRCFRYRYEYSNIKVGHFYLHHDVLFKLLCKRKQVCSFFPLQNHIIPMLSDKIELQHKNLCTFFFFLFRFRLTFEGHLCRKRGVRRGREW